MITWDGVKPGTIVTYLPVGGSVARRVLVEKVENSRSGNVNTKWLLGVEVTSRYGLRSRRGAIPGQRCPFFVSLDEVRGVMQPGATTERLTAQVQRLRAAAVAAP